MRRFLFIVGALVAAAYAGGEWFRRHPRVGTRFMNETVGPWLLAKGVVGSSRGEIATLEHVGRRTGTTRLALVHPTPIPDGVRIIVPLGSKSEWASNVMAAGHCRMQVGDRLIELDEPVLELPSEVPGLPAPTRALYEWLGFRELRLHTFSEGPGELTAPAPTPKTAEAKPAVPVA